MKDLFNLPCFCLLLIVCFVLRNPVSGQSYYDVQSIYSSSGGTTEAKYLAEDGLGNLYVGGDYEDTLRFSNGDQYFSPQTSVFAAKYDSLGNVIWSVASTSISDWGGIMDMKTDSAGNLYLAGFLRDDLTFPGSATLVNSGSIADGFVARFSPAGQLVFLRHFTGNGWILPYQMGVFDNGDVAVSGRYDGQFVNGANTYTGVGFADLFLTRLDGNTGNPVWTDTSSGYWGVGSLQVGKSGNIYMGANVDGDVSLGGTTYASIGNNDVLFAAFDQNGGFKWAAREGGTSADYVWDMDLDGRENVYFSGQLGVGTISFQGTSVTSQGLDIFTAKFDSSGTFKWVETTWKSTVNNVYGIAVSDEGTSYLFGQYSDSFAMGPLLVTSFGGFNNYYIGSYDSSGVPVSLDGIGAGAGQLYPEDIFVSRDGDLWVCGAFSNQVTLGGTLLSKPSGLGPFIGKYGNVYENRITGRVFRDYNGNGIIDGADGPFPNVLTRLNAGVGYDFSDFNGQYEYYTDTGTFFIDLTGVPQYHQQTFPAGGYSVNFSSSPSHDSTGRFGIQPIPGIQDLKITAVFPANARLATPFNNSFLVENAGTDTLAPVISYVPYPGSVINSATPAPGSLSADTLVWNLPNLLPGDVTWVNVSLSLPVSTFLSQIGGNLSQSVWVDPVVSDTTPADNRHDFSQLIGAPYDPNDKKGFPGDILTPAQVAAGQEITYTVRFQNTGNDTAFNVVIRDTLDAQLDISTLQMVGSSHNYSVRFFSNRLLEWRFEGINLPDSTTDFAGSQGFITYRIEPFTTLSIGDKFHNTAGIYFDYNPAIVTNTTEHVVEIETAVFEANPTGGQILLYPNPAREYVNIRLEGTSATYADVVIHDLSGRAVLREHLVLESGVSGRVDVSGLADGLFLMEVQVNGERYVTKVLVR